MTVPVTLPSPVVAPSRAGLTDRLGRTATDLRVSLTDRCNLACTYCMPAAFADAASAADSLSPPVPPQRQTMTRAEIVRLVSIASRDLGVTAVRLTGGEPLLRGDLPDIIADLARLTPRPEIALTTNGVGFASRAARLHDAGLDRVNISLDTLDPHVFSALTGKNAHARVLDAIETSLIVFDTVKVNAVLTPVTLDHAPRLVAWCLARSVDIRFIEHMPLGGGPWGADTFVSAANLHNVLSRDFVLTPWIGDRAGAPAQRFDVYPRGGTGSFVDAMPGDAPASRPLGRIGIIASITQPFCADCRRTRLTADGAVRSCLFDDTETDLLTSLRSGASDADLAALWRDAMWTKRPGHGCDNGPLASLADATATPLTRTRTMSAIGG
ncbi:MAG: GTP 3',8-cyclase MoaA [Cellulomonadaceae bacterium]|nr:GTP 3',8-cyclase MoaA [Cellulomonadaceae bacterium]